MGKSCIFCCFFLFFHLAGWAQAAGTALPIHTLLHSSQPVTISWNDTFFSIPDTPYNRFSQALLKTSDGLFVFINGSGRLYQVLERDSSITLQRIDSTFYAGYNFGSFPFVYRDSIFSFGGYGLWRINGQLRVYMPEAHSWEIVGLNEEIPVMMQGGGHNLLWYSQQEERLYIGYSVARNQAVQQAALNEATFDYTVRYLDLKTKSWHKAGALNDYFKDKATLLQHLAFTPWGQLVNFGDKLFLIDYAENRLLYMQNKVESRVKLLLNRHPNTNLYYCIDSTLYFGSLTGNTLNSFPLHRSDFADAGIAVYTTPRAFAPVLAGSVAVVLVLASIVLTRKKRTQKALLQRPSAANEEGKSNATDTKVASLSMPSHPFDERELQVIQLIWQNNQQALPTTIDDMNAVLGLTRKSVDTQKNQRSAVLKSINAKYSLWKNTPGKLIESKQVATDKRSREYYIAPGNETALLELMEAYA